MRLMRDRPLSSQVPAFPPPPDDPRRDPDRRAVVPGCPSSPQSRRRRWTSARCGCPERPWSRCRGKPPPRRRRFRPRRSRGATWAQSPTRGNRGRRSREVFRIAWLPTTESIFTVAEGRDHRTGLDHDAPSDDGRRGQRDPVLHVPEGSHPAPRSVRPDRDDDLAPLPPVRNHGSGPAQHGYARHGLRTEGARDCRRNSRRPRSPTPATRPITTFACPPAPMMTNVSGIFFPSPPAGENP